MRTEKRPSAFVESLRRDFQNMTGLLPELTSDYERQLQPFVEFLEGKDLLPFDERKRSFLSHANRKFRMNAEALKRFYRVGADQCVTFNYHQKTQVQLAFDSGQVAVLKAVLDARCVQEPTRRLLIECFVSVSEIATIAHIRRECEEPTKLREYSKLRKSQGNDGVSQEIVLAQFSAFLFASLSLPEMHSFFDAASGGPYVEDFWAHLQHRAPNLFNRLQALHVIYVKPEKIETEGYEGIRSALEAAIRASYEGLNNYGYLCLIIPPLALQGRDHQAELVAETTLYAEKHIEVLLRKNYFKPKNIQKATETCVGGELVGADFHIANEGFTYRDCFVITPESESLVGETMAVVLFQKNRRNETIIPCPVCRSANVQGNSYQILGVKSWECNNLLCPDRSKYNRGKRYTFRGLLMQQAIDDPTNEIPKTSVRSWVRDVQHARTLNDVLEMLTRHYSLDGDTIHVFDWPNETENTLHGRTVKAHELANHGEGHDGFWEGPLFRRYVIPRRQPGDGQIKRMGDKELTVLCGDAFQVLLGVGDASYDGAVTSPPYYNAREYSQWPNIYCYLYDMFNINREVFRTLKPGSYYLYNIFDYFDNEYSTAFSAMGQKRMILSAYTVNMFRRIGFECLGNVAWDKGDIEGKRGFNAGNFSPYYQAPFNCWEHILVFRRPIQNGFIPRFLEFPAVLRERAVLKMVRGENTHGHSAPFPDAIPDLLISQLEPGQTVLDPFAGSLTTGRVAERRGVRSLCIERSADYCNLGLQMRVGETAGTTTKQGTLF